MVIPAYNAAAYLHEAIDSARQSGADRIIVVDDGSLDGTAARARELGVVVHAQENSGASVAREAGAALVETDYVVFLDADDRLLPQGVRNSIQVLDGHLDCAVAAGTVMTFSRRSSDVRHSPIRYNPVTVRSLLEVGYGPWPPANAVVRMRHLRESQKLQVPPLNLRFADDYELLIRLAMVGDIQVRADPTCFYSLDGGKSSRSAGEAIRAKEHIREYYARANDVEIILLKPREIRRSAIARTARAQKAAGNYLKFVIYLFRWVLLDPPDTCRRILRRLSSPR